MCLAPAAATKKSHPEIRQACKAILLGVNYGMGAEAIAAQSGLHVVDARNLLRLHRQTYRQFWAWADGNVNRALLGLPLETVFGWRIHYPPSRGVTPKPTSILNWPMQSHGAEMMRLAAAIWTAAGSPSQKKREAMLRKLKCIPALIVVTEARTPTSYYRVGKGAIWSRANGESQE